MKQQLLLLDWEIHKMNLETGRPNHIEDALVRIHNGQWFGWNGKEKIYANLIIHDDSKTKPTEEELNAKLLEIQNEFDGKEARKASAKSKLEALGLTTEEIKEAFGI
jgi:hypothetical protein